MSMSESASERLGLPAPARLVDEAHAAGEGSRNWEEITWLGRVHVARMDHVVLAPLFEHRVPVRIRIRIPKFTRILTPPVLEHLARHLILILILICILILITHQFSSSWLVYSCAYSCHTYPYTSTTSSRASGSAPQRSRARRACPQTAKGSPAAMQVGEEV